MSLRKDVKLGDDKRTISTIPSNEVNLYNISNGELLTDEYGNPVIAEVDEYFLKDATASKSTSIVLATERQTSTKYQKSSIGTKTATYFSTNTNSVGILTAGIQSGDLISGASIPGATIISRVEVDSIFISNKTLNTTSPLTESVLVERIVPINVRSNPVIKIKEQFKETSEVSTTLLGINRAETQLSLFSNVSSYGLDPDEFEFYGRSEGYNVASWENRRNALYGNRYRFKQVEETQESGIKITSFPAPYSYPFGPKFEKTGLYNDTLFKEYLNFIDMGNDLYNLPWVGYPSSWKEKFLSPGFAKRESGDVTYGENIDDSFAKIDTWTETWRDIKSPPALVDPITNLPFTFATVKSLIPGRTYTQDSTRPGYSSSLQRYAYLQSRRVFRYQPGRISGFTFGLRSSKDPIDGVILEWGIANPTDQYVFRVNAGRFSIVRRSTVPLEPSVLRRNGLKDEDQDNIPSGDPFDTKNYWTIDIPRDKFNGDPLNSNGKSGYLLNLEKVTMYKIEFGWYGAIGARFYAYIPTDNGDARWVVIHTLVIENSLESPCLRDSYFRFKYSLSIANTVDVRSPQYLYKYGASYYIDGGDEGTSQIYSVSSNQKTILSGNEKTLLGIRPKEFILNRDGVEIENKKLIIPTELNISSDSLSEVKVVTCAACPGFGHVYTPGIATTESGRSIDIQFTDLNTIAAINDSYFSKSDEGAKIIAPSIYNAYITDVSGEVGTSGSFRSATIKGFGGIYGFNLVDRDIPSSFVFDRVAGIATQISTKEPYPYPVRLSNYNAYAASDYKFTGSKIEIQFINPNKRDDYEHWADFLIGVTNKVPDTLTGAPDELNGFFVGAASTTVLPNKDILFGTHTHSFAAYDEDGVERGESWPTDIPPLRMGIDYRIPIVPDDIVNNVVIEAGGVCSKISIEVQEPSPIANAVQYGANPQSGEDDGSFYIEIPGSFPALTYEGGQVAFEYNGSIYTPNITYVGDPVGPYLKPDDNYFSYIKISGQIPQSNNFDLLLRAVLLTGTGEVNSGKLFNYNPFPLYLVAKLQDNAQINNITVKETIGNFQKTVTPKWYKYDNASIELYGGKADNFGTPPTNFTEIDRLSSALIDTQNNSQLRPSITRDTLYVGASDTKSINMSKVFGADKRVITPDNNNIEATFIVAKKINSGSGSIETSLNFKEQ